MTERSNAPANGTSKPVSTATQAAGHELGQTEARRARPIPEMRVVTKGWWILKEEREATPDYKQVLHAAE